MCNYKCDCSSSLQSFMQVLSLGSNANFESVRFFSVNQLKCPKLFSLVTCNNKPLLESLPWAMFTPLISNFSYRSPSLKSFHGSMPRGCTSSSSCFLGQCPLPTSMAENNLSSREQSLCRRCRVNLQLFPWQIIFCGRRPFRGYLVVTFTKIVDHLITVKLSGGFLVVSPTFTDSVYPRLVK